MKTKNNWNPVVFPVYRFGYNKIDSRTRLLDVWLTLNFKENVKMGPTYCWGSLRNCWGVTCDGLASCLGGVEILLAASWYRNEDKLGPL